MTNAPALSFGVKSGERCLSTESLRDQTMRAASGYAALGVKRGDCVALLMRNEPVFLVASIAAAHLGAYAVPINWHFAPEEITHILADCAPKVLVVHGDLLTSLRPLLLKDLHVLAVATPAEVRLAYRIDDAACVPAEFEEWGAWLGRQPPWRGAALPSAQSMIYTSGTTGHPKAVRRELPTPEQALGMDALRARVYGIVPGTRVLVPGPMYHSAPNACALRAVRDAELTLLMPRFDAEAFLQLVERERISTAFMVPTMFLRLLKLPDELRRRHDLSSLKFVVHAGAPCPPDVKLAMIRWWGPILHEYYGGTESGPVTFATSEEFLAHPGTVGRPVPGATIRICDDSGYVQPTGKAGEIFMRIECFPDFTYHGQPETRRQIERDGLITCGDVGYFDDAGYLYICDRKRDMVISGGVNIYPAEIEAVLHNLEGIKDCAVFGIPDTEYGEALMAVVEPLDGYVLDAEVVRASLRAHLAGYKVPRSVEIRRDLPREDSGKIFKRRLREPYWLAAGRAI